MRDSADADRDPAGLPGLDLAALRRHLDDHAPELLPGELRGSLIPGGRSNLTYVVSAEGRDVVLRRPPLGHVLATAHDMSREFRVIAALADSPVPVPRALLMVDDPAVLGAPFYLMERVDGTVVRRPEDAEGLDATGRIALSRSLVDVLADIHDVDPEAAGLGDLGRPDGYLERQVVRWGRQLDASRSRELEGIEELRARLLAGVPPSRRTGIVHGDYRLDNLLVDLGGGGPRIRAVLDWEMATLGDPLADLGLLLVYWDGLAAMDNPVASGVGPGSGFAPGRDLVERYAERTGADVDGLNWYVALGYFKLAVVLEGIHYRYVHGQTVGAGFDRIGEVVPALVAAGLAR